jgi:predicted nucleic acid-binding protein
VSEDGGAIPAPLILDASVLIAVARGDAGIMTLIQGYDADGQPMVIPAMAVTAALLDRPGEDAEALLHGLDRMGNVMVAPVRDADQAARLAAVISTTGLDPCDAHVAAVADASVCAILTLDGAKWQEHARDLDEPLHYIEITDPEDE